MKRLVAAAGAVALLAPSTAGAAGPSPDANCTARFVVYDVIQAGAPRGASEDLAVIARPPKSATSPPLRSDVGASSSTNCS